MRSLLCSPPVVRFICVRMWGPGVLPTALPAPLSTTLSPLSLALWVFPAKVVRQGLLVVRLPALFVPHSASLSPATATRVLSTQVSVSAPPTSLDEGLFSISLVLVPLAVHFSVSSGCARRRSVSTYAAIFVPPSLCFKSCFISCLHLLYYCFPVYVLIQLVYPSFLTGSFLCC